ncbi:MAG: hypothetical protein VX589_09335 [Myxococcota bacterium]|nr:hypothetical protein [Myxococcota bacterium]
MSILSKMGPPTGIWAAAWSILRSPTALAGVLVVLGMMTVVGADSDPGQHPAAGVIYRLMWILLPLMGLARAIEERRGRSKWAGIILALGLAVLGIASWQVSQTTGWVNVGQSPVETYERASVNGPVSVHLGAQLKAVSDGAFATVSLAMRDQTLGGPVTLSTGTQAEGKLGRFRLYVSHETTGKRAEQAALRVHQPSGEHGAHRDFVLKPGATIALDKETTLRLLQVRADFLSTLGAAAEVQVSWADKVETFWVYADAPDMDERLGQAPWRIQLLALETPRFMVLGLRLATVVDYAVWTGLALVLLGLLLGVGPLRKTNVT